LSSHLRLGPPSGLLPSGLPTKMYAPLTFPMRAVATTLSLNVFDDSVSSYMWLLQWTLAIVLGFFKHDVSEIECFRHQVTGEENSYSVLRFYNTPPLKDIFFRQFLP
jgi:hypothetical protein